MLLDQLAAGEIMAPAFAVAGVTSDQVRVWRFEQGAQGEREREWQAARQQSADAYADKILDVAYNERDSNAARVRIQALQWLAARRDPRVYADKAQLDVNVRTIDLTRIIDAANQRLAASQAGRVIEGEVLRAGLPAALDDLL